MLTCDNVYFIYIIHLLPFYFIILYCRCSLSSKYAYVVSFTVEKVYRVSLFFVYSRSQLEKFVIDLLVPRTNKKTVG